MGFGEWYLRRGRITRRTFWLHYVLPMVALSLLAGIADGVLGYPGLSTTVPSAYEGSVYAVTGGPLELLVSLFFLVPNVASTVARLHDRGRPAWWLLWYLVPLVGWVVLLVQTGFLRGDGGPNAYGPAPGGGPVRTMTRVEPGEG